jgi:hypothetical protein
VTSRRETPEPPTHNEKSLPVLNSLRINPLNSARKQAHTSAINAQDHPIGVAKTSRQAQLLLVLANESCFVSQPLIASCPGLLPSSHQAGHVLFLINQRYTYHTLLLVDESSSLSLSLIFALS